ncbi:DUF3043 domain-containing protein [Mycobacterium sp. 1274756.6]|uniref:DUF3043 domain-containing protein n=1 Tax=Mycobacterium sp. 1274756.6 TaxID=1834076 RepID=UPI0007FF14CD|nr:DUF3043 domain-containing protein [Mycobacterium sp. 1274756.6]OBJ67572.1 hypothetical protein A5643_16860 [Mycobacterium sp. 1274756.6]
MRLLGRRKDDDRAADTAGGTDEADEATRAAHQAGTTPPKGRPTPRRDAARRRGPVAPPPMTAAEARARRKELAGPKLSREERRAQRAERLERRTEYRERMMAGEDAYLLQRDRGPVRRLVRDLVDSRRNLLGLFIPSAMLLLFLTLSMPLAVQRYVSLGLLVLMAAMAVDAVLLGRHVGRRVDEKFPDNTEARWRLTMYAAGRASQLRRMRAPRPQVARGERID